MQRTSKLTLSALLLALTYIATLFIQVPIPITNGYIHPGDTFVILSAIFLGPVYGSIVSGLGSMFADITSGYILYVPATLIIKALSAFIVGYFFKNSKNIKASLKVLIAGCIHCVVIVVGYAFFEAIVFSLPVALIAVPSTLIQGLISLVLSFIIYSALIHIPSIKKHL